MASSADSFEEKRLAKLHEKFIDGAEQFSTLRLVAITHPDLPEWRKSVECHGPIVISPNNPLLQSADWNKDTSNWWQGFGKKPPVDWLVLDFGGRLWAGGIFYEGTQEQGLQAMEVFTNLANCLQTEFCLPFEDATQPFDPNRPKPCVRPILNLLPMYRPTDIFLPEPTGTRITRSPQHKCLGPWEKAKQILERLCSSPLAEYPSMYRHPPEVPRRHCVRLPHNLFTISTQYIEDGIRLKRKEYGWWPKSVSAQPASDSVGTASSEPAERLPDEGANPQALPTLPRAPTSIPPDGLRWYTQKEIVTYCDVSPKTVYNWLHPERTGGLSVHDSRGNGGKGTRYLLCVEELELKKRTAAAMPAKKNKKMQ
jgi:hypothetical protein